MHRREKRIPRDLITQHVMLRALAGVTQGKTYDLAEEIYEGMPEIPGLARFQFAFTHTPEGTALDGGMEFCAEVFSATAHCSTHIDALVHIQSDGKIFEDHAVSDARGDRGWKTHGVETIPPLIGRGVVIDVAKFLDQPRLPDGYEITARLLEDSLEAVDGSLEPGDIVLVRTGKIQQFNTDPDAFMAGQPGIGRDAAIWLADQGVAVICSDTATTEPFPLADPTHTAHVAMLVDRGVHLIENLNLEALSAEAVTHGLFIALPLKLRGATGSWVRPVLLT